MQKDDSLPELVDIVRNIGRICNEEGIRVDIDFDPNDGIILIKHENTNSIETTCVINSNNKTVSGIDTSKFWLPDYSKTQKANKKILQFLQTKGYSASSIKYKKIEKSK